MAVRMGVGIDIMVVNEIVNGDCWLLYTDSHS
jgi:hypothetical protein